MKMFLLFAGFLLVFFGSTILLQSFNFKFIHFMAVVMVAIGGGCFAFKSMME